ncbi:hypothetical protein ACFYQT_40275 [Streptomyces tibetensis]|uniref:Secreted protein n=1 Tax=Streptomyces tibetensis TaxID=2382123 RepID=A0ABW6N8S7_9ACTN
MTKRIRLLAASLAIAVAAVAGIALAVDTSTTPPDTTWGAAPIDVVEDTTGLVLTPLDTTWG